VEGFEGVGRGLTDSIWLWKSEESRKPPRRNRRVAHRANLVHTVMEACGKNQKRENVPSPASPSKRPIELSASPLFERELGRKPQCLTMRAQFLEHGHSLLSSKKKCRYSRIQPHPRVRRLEQRKQEAQAWFSAASKFTLDCSLFLKCPVCCLGGPTFKVRSSLGRQLFISLHKLLA
jgi:hypothetical protein